MFDKNLLRSELVYKSITLQKLAEKLGVSKGTISKKINGNSEWTLFEIQQIGKIIGKDKLLAIFFN